MKNEFKVLGIITLIVVIGMMFCGCNNDTSDNGKKTPEEMTVAERWGKWIDPTSTATIDYSVGSDNVCTIIVGGIPQPNNQTDNWGRWKARAHYNYTKEVGKFYVYTFEAWTQSGVRNLTVQYYEDNDVGIYYDETFLITDTRTTYTVYGKRIPKGGIDFVGFLCADQLGTFYVKMLEIR